MADIIINNISLIIFLPLWLFLIIMLGRFFSVYVNKKIIHILTLLTSLFGSIVCVFALLNTSSDTVYESSYHFIKINNFIINYGLQIDRISLTFALVLFIVSFFVQLFSIPYMKDEKKEYRFFALLNLFNFSLAGLFFSPNLFQTYFFWEISGIVSYLLIGFDYSKENKSLASKKVFIMNRIGDTALIGAIILCSYFMYEYAPAKSLTTLSFIDLNSVSTLTSVYAPEILFKVICLLFIVASAVKSAQILFYPWLQDAMEAKLPVSALLHSATLVVSGLFLLIRTLDFYTTEEIFFKVIAVIGLLTALICSLSACAQTHPKKVLAYSTSAQLGLMFFAVGILNIKAAVVFFIAHAFIKSMLFLTLPKENNKWNYTSFVTFLVGGLSLSGLIFSGMIAKEMISFGITNNVIVLIFSILSFLTSFYIIRIALVLANKCDFEKKRPEWTLYIPALGLLICNIIFYIYLRNHFEYKIAEPFWAALTAWVVVYVLYIKNAFFKVTLIYPLCLNGFYLDKIYTSFIVKAYNSIAYFCNLTDKNIFMNYKQIVITTKYTIKFANWVENKIMNKTVELIVSCLKSFSKIDLRAQNGNVQRYNLYAFIIVTTLITILILIYTAILSYYGGN